MTSIPINWASGQNHKSCCYHLGLNFPDLFPPHKDMYVCDICNRTYHWQCLLITNCYNANEREAIDTNDTRACPVCVNPNENGKKGWFFISLKNELVKVSWSPIWKPEGLQGTCDCF